MKLKKPTAKKQTKNGIELVTTNNNGVFQQEEVKGKLKDTLSWGNCKLYHHGIGQVISEDIRPKFADWNFIDYVKEHKHTGFVRFLEPMSAYEDTTYLKDNPKDATEIAELKMDGHRGTISIGSDFNRVFSRRVSKKTDWYNENTDQVPHIRDLILPEYAGTILDGEFDYGTTSMGVQSVMGALPANAIQYQFNNGFIKFFGFDILYYKGINVQKMPLWKRKVYLMEVLSAFWSKYANCNMEFAKIYAHPQAHSTLLKWWKSYADRRILDLLEESISIVPDYRDKFQEVLERGQEGLMIKKIHSTYEQKKTKNMIKLKGVSTWDCVMMGLTEPTKEYDGKELTTWNYWETPEGELVQDDEVTEGQMLVNNGYIPVSKPYFMGWCGGISFGVWREFDAMDIDTMSHGGYDYRDYVEDLRGEGLLLEKDGKTFELVQVGDCKGLTEAIMIDLKENWQKYVSEQRVVEVKANGIIDKEKGSLRHPRFAKWRDDKGSEMCLWNDHIREIWE